MAKKAQSQGKQCAAMHCFYREYIIINGERVSTSLNFFSFPIKDRARINQWCNLIKRGNNKDGFTVSKHTQICEKQFEDKCIYRPPGWKKSRLVCDPGINGENVILYQNQENKETGRGRKQSLAPLKCFILTNFAFLFQVKETTISTTITTWINYLYI